MICMFLLILWKKSLKDSFVNIRQKVIGKHKDGGNLRKEFIEKENEGEEEEVKIIRTKQFGMKPMFPEDACVQMELLGHSFFVFRNADTDEVNVVYKRKGKYIWTESSRSARIDRIKELHHLK